MYTFSRNLEVNEIILILQATGMLAQGHALFDKQVILFSIIFFINYSITLVTADAIHLSV